MPTVLDGLGLEVPEGLFGESLWPVARGERQPRDRLVAAEGVLYGPEMKAGILWPHKIILDPSSGRATVFDLQADPGETTPLDGPTGLFDELRERLELRLLVAREGVEYTEGELDAELVRRLRALGYIR
jgi:hypothetical protein